MYGTKNYAALNVHGAKVENPCAEALILKSLVGPGCGWGMGVGLGPVHLGRTQLKANLHLATQSYCSKKLVHGYQVIA